MRTVHSSSASVTPTYRASVRRAAPPELLLGGLGVPALLVLLHLLIGLTWPAWASGLVSGWGVVVVLGLALRQRGGVMGPADRVTLTRALLGAGVVALIVQGLVADGSVTALVTLTAIALVLDAVDGQVARRTATTSSLGASFDGEVDAYLILWLSIAVTPLYGPWVLAIGLARYAMWLAGRLIPWLAAPVPPRYWRKVVAAIQGITLTVAVSGVLPRPVGIAAVAVALALLTESFGHDIWWLRRRRAGRGAR